MISSRRATTVAAAVLALSLTAGCGSSADRSATTSTSLAPQKTPSKVPATVTRTVDRLKAGEKPGGNDSFTGTGVQVRDDGKLYLVLHTAGALTDDQKAELNALGAEIVVSGSDEGARGDNGNLAPFAEGIVDAWIPFAQVEAAAALPWVVSVTVPTPTRNP